jgi:hypothetical protein
MTGPRTSTFAKATADKRGGSPTTLFLRNEANFSECWTMWIGFMDNVLAVEVRRFVAWLRLFKIGFVWGRS